MQYINGHLLDAVNNAFADATPGLTSIEDSPSMCQLIVVDGAGVDAAVAVG